MKCDQLPDNLKPCKTFGRTCSECSLNNYDNYIFKCYNCENFINKEPHSARSAMWYNHKCKKIYDKRAVEEVEKKYGMGEIEGSQEYPEAWAEMFLECRYAVKNKKCIKNNKHYQYKKMQEVSRFDLMDID